MAMFTWFKRQIPGDEYGLLLNDSVEWIVRMTLFGHDTEAEGWNPKTARVGASLWEGMNASRLRLEAVKPDGRLGAVHRNLVRTLRAFLTVVNKSAQGDAGGTDLWVSIGEQQLAHLTKELRRVKSGQRALFDLLHPVTAVEVLLSDEEPSDATIAKLRRELDDGRGMSQ